MDASSPPLSLLGPMSAADRAASGGSPPLRWLLESRAFAESESKLTIAMGEDCAGQPCIVDLKRLPHLLVGGLAGSGTSTFLRAVVATLLFRCGPGDLRLFLFSSAPGVFRAFEGLPHLLAQPTSDPEAALAFLEWAQHEMNRRYIVLAAAGVRHVDAFNHVPPLLCVLEPLEGPGCLRPATIPYLVAVFDDLSALAGRWGDGARESAVELCQMSRVAGIHLLMAARNLSVDALPAHLLVNIHARMSFRQARSIDSSILLGLRGAEELTEAGEALFWPPGTRTAVSLRGPWVTEEGLQRVVAMWRGQSNGNTTPAGRP